MSHRAMNWALERRELKPAPWRVLVMLADRHNKDTLRVDPEQALLAHDCNMSRSTVNRHLDDLESAGLLVRVPRINPKTQKQMPTFYVLGIDFAKPPQIEFAVSDYETRIRMAQNENIGGSRVPNSDTGAVSQKTQIPCPKNDDSRVSKSDTNPVREPKREPCAPVPGAPVDLLFNELFETFVAAYPRIGNIDKTREALADAIDGGVSADHIIAAAKKYANEKKGISPQYVAYSENWLINNRWTEHVHKPAVDQQQVHEKQAQQIKDCKPWVPSTVTAHRARHLISLDLVTLADCKKAGVNL